jgi:hypothetical protein
VFVNARGRARATHFGGIAANPVLVEREVFISSSVFTTIDEVVGRRGGHCHRIRAGCVMGPGTGTMICTCVD